MNLINFTQKTIRPIFSIYRSSIMVFVRTASTDEKVESGRLKEFREKLKQKTPIKKLEEIEGPHPYQEKEPLPPWPNNTNPHTGEIGGPRGPEPTRYGDWERKGRVTDF